jgi:hypothetical protein
MTGYVKMGWYGLTQILSGIFNPLMADITKEKLVEILRGLLETDADLGFLMGLKKTEIETLVACIRNRIEEVGK